MDSTEKIKLLPKHLFALIKQYQQQTLGHAIKDWFYNYEWQIKPRQLQAIANNMQLPQQGKWLILADQGGIGEALAELLQQRGHKCILVYAGDSYQVDQTKSKEKYYLNPVNLGDFQSLFQQIVEPLKLPLHGAIDLWSLDAQLTPELTISALEAAQRLSCASVLHLLQTIVQRSWSVWPRLWVVTRAAVGVLDTDTLAVAQSSVWGLGKVIALEHPEIWGGMLDLPASGVMDEAATLLAEIEHPENEGLIAFRNQKRYVARLVPTIPPQPQKVLFRTDSTYLITGGLGDLGLWLARWMVEMGARHLILTGRRGASAQTQETLNQLKHKGADIKVAQADVSKMDDMARVFEQVQTSMPPLRGIFHAAGVLDDGILLRQNWERFTRVMAPKVQGAWNLHILSQNQQLDFFVCFSSFTALTGNLGQGNYAAANTFLDALVHYRHKSGLPASSINWGRWADTGMALTAQSQLEQMGVQGMPPEQALAILGYLLAAGVTQAAVAKVNWVLERETHKARQQQPLLERIWTNLPVTQVASQTSIQPPEILHQLQAAMPSQRREMLMAHIQNRIAKILGLNDSQLPSVEQGFLELGMDSLMSVELKNQLEKDLETALHASLLFNYSTITALVDYLTSQVLTLDFGTDPVKSEPDQDNSVTSGDSIISTTDATDLEEMSQMEIAELLAQKLANI
ncbi:SDR family NAD(P)-dependent oxidoreductase [Nostoc sp. CENA67]|uniref:SDR family NAD(P)-dependent oxidoreductase n=1 Tax=Amazonocrinis nigriterrae CENA67 TaxID=2794033 RepID=A0A8J7L6L0_9NOST|nr:beta-ketoacyl reductase [Amazonocrinis nigriterrae]MBH8561398.1 SDR family NAD(P)-dependent oxidoreductase [Amazonocrinis nigriterrae CENA67]